MYIPACPVAHSPRAAYVQGRAQACGAGACIYSSMCNRGSRKCSSWCGCGAGSQLPVAQQQAPLGQAGKETATNRALQSAPSSQAPARQW
jgi:hypothetical protein